MLNFILPILKNPLTRMVSSKIIGGIQHKMEKDKIIRAKEIEATSKADIAKIGVQLEQVRQQDNSLKDEWLCLFFTILMGLHFWPPAQDTMERGWSILQKADPMFWYIILTIVGASFGVTTMNKLKKK
tara:strand:- start:892 stop:1275 length:384 start_codon:yes stop_codon:yes gene_type:complete